MNVKKTAKDQSNLKCSTAQSKADTMFHEDKFVLESLEDPKHVTEYLRTVIDGIEKGRIVLGGNEKELVLQPSSLIKFSIKGKRSSHKSKLSIKLSWSRLADDRE